MGTWPPILLLALALAGTMSSLQEGMKWAHQGRQSQQLRKKSMAASEDELVAPEWRASSTQVWIGAPSLHCLMRGAENPLPAANPWRAAAPSLHCEARVAEDRPLPAAPSLHREASEDPRAVRIPGR